MPDRSAAADARKADRHRLTARFDTANHDACEDFSPVGRGVENSHHPIAGQFERGEVGVLEFAVGKRSDQRGESCGLCEI